VATYAPSAARPVRRPADTFGRFAAVASLLGLLVAVALTVPSSWYATLFGEGESPAGPTYADLTPAAPVRVSAASAGGVEIVAPLVESDVAPRQALLAPPDDAPLVTWWRDGAQAGAPKGQTVLLAHAGIDGGGLVAIADLTKGDFVDLLTDNGTMRYEVASVRTFSVKTMDRVSTTLFKQDGGAGRLVMVSAQDWDGSRYTRNVVVTGTPLGQPRG
jgi:hypothetical protein